MPEERRRAGNDIATASLYNMLNFILSLARETLNDNKFLKILFVISDIHYLRGPDVVNETLWIQGKPGSGKSVLAKSILAETFTASDAVMASWFYSKRGGVVGMSHTYMLRSACYQLLQQRKELFASCARIYRKEGFGEQSFAVILEAVVTGAG
ncbi:hypothetical protein F4801DRAFT_585923 [Xylaria longipes]|nr:hypothetical protein F4801DRAFT_585923 [Xylaria longipes]